MRLAGRDGARAVRRVAVHVRAPVDDHQGVRRDRDVARLGVRERAVLAGEVSGALTELNELAKGGKDLGRLLSDLLSHFRNLLIFQVSKGDLKLLEASEAEVAALQEQASLASVDALTRILEALADAELRLRDAASKMQKANENLFARNFYNRLRHAASSELQISDGLKKLAKQTIGLKAEEIGDGLKSAVRKADANLFCAALRMAATDS